MVKRPLLDAPIDSPDGDLLGMNPYALSLARFISGEVPPYLTPPFTVGVYGKWGEGKTSFVQLVQHHLTAARANQQKPAPSFITFPTWSYSDADTLWRAFILQIARELYHEDDEAPPSLDDSATPQGWFERLGAFLRSPAFTLMPPEPPPAEKREYKQIKRLLEQSAYGSPAPQSEATGLDQAGVLTVLGAALGAMGSVSPLLASLRSFLGLETNLDLVSRINSTRNQVAQEALTSVKQFRSIFSAIIERRANGQPVYIFIDDLDRCTPEAALELLEAIKILLPDEVPCIFIVAADEDQIGKGLLLRDRARTPAGPASSPADDNRSGQEYLEKIIQLGVRVPPQSLEVTHSFIGAQFPAWIGASDIFRLVLGSNPRRLKQHCNRLSYLQQVYHLTHEDGANG
jgi:hypothetical protein